MDFAAVAHDLRTPLAAMLGHTQLLAVEGLSDSAMRRLHVIEAQIRRMVMLIERCTPTSDPADSPAPCVGGTSLQAPVDVPALIQNVVAELEPLCERRGIQLTVNLEPPLPTVAGDAQELHRLLVNVFANAADAMRDGGRISVRAWLTCEAADSMPAVEIDIADTGTGMAPDVVARMFDRGFTTKPRGQGSGLGLAICRDIVRAHGGTIDVRTGVGRGTTIQIRVPVSQATAAQR